MHWLTDMSLACMTLYSKQGSAGPGQQHSHIADSIPFVDIWQLNLAPSSMNRAIYFSDLIVPV